MGPGQPGLSPPTRRKRTASPACACARGGAPALRKEGPPAGACAGGLRLSAVGSGKRLVTDGPFAETREQLGGYLLVDAKNLDEAIAIGTRIPMARKGTVEVRPAIEISGLPNA